MYSKRLEFLLINNPLPSRERIILDLLGLPNYLLAKCDRIVFLQYHVHRQYNLLF